MQRRGHLSGLLQDMMIRLNFIQGCKAVKISVDNYVPMGAVAHEGNNPMILLAQQQRRDGRERHSGSLGGLTLGQASGQRMHSNVGRRAKLALVLRRPARGQELRKLRPGNVTRDLRYAIRR